MLLFNGSLKRKRFTATQPKPCVSTKQHRVSQKTVAWGWVTVNFYVAAFFDLKRNQVSVKFYQS